MVHGVPDNAEPPRTPEARSGVPPSHIRAVLFDFHGTLAQVEPAVDWVLGAAAETGLALDRPRATQLADRLVTAGRAGGPLPYRVPPHLAEVWSDRDLYERCHRAAYVGLAQTVDTGVPGFAEALYDRLLRPEGWVVYPDTAPTLKALRAAGVPIAVVSNIGFDIRPLFVSWGLADVVDAYVLSYEVGRCKPDPAIFLHACSALGVPPERALMVGDTPADAGAVRVGCPALVLPAADSGEPNGLAAALALVG